MRKSHAFTLIELLVGLSIAVKYTQSLTHNPVTRDTPYTVTAVTVVGKK